MNEQLRAELLKIVTNINNGVDSAWGFLTEQTPDVVYQLLLWHGVYSFIRFVLGCVFIGVWVWANMKLYKWFKALPDPGPNAEVIALQLFQIFLIFIPILTINLTWLKIWIAPKVWLLEYIIAIVK